MSPTGATSTTGSMSGAVDSDATLSGPGTFGVDLFPSIAVAPLEPGDNVHTYDAGFVRPVAMGDVVWIDLDGDGRQDAGEPGLAGVIVRLFQVGGDGNVLLDADGDPVPVINLLGEAAVARTDDLGRYVIDDLLPGTYVAQFMLPDGYAFTTSTADGVGSAADSDAVPTEADPLVGITAPFTISATPSGGTIATSSYPGGDVLRAGLIDPTIDAGVIPLGTIAGVLWRDEDRDGLRDDGEASIAPQQVVLRDASGDIVATTTSAADGSYSFTGLPPGTYTVETATPAGLAPTVEGAGSPLNDSATSPATVTLAYGAMVLEDVDFGFVDLAITGTVWFDADQDAGIDAGERLLGGVTVELLTADGTTVLATTTTAADGSYRFDGLDEASYLVRFTPPDGMFAATGTQLEVPVTLTAEVGVVDAGLYAPRVSVGDLVWFDADADGIQDEGEPGIPGVLLGLEVWDGTAWVAAVDVYGTTVAPLITDEYGRYLFTDLPFGEYRVTVLEPPAGMVPTTAVAGDDRSVDSSTGSAESGPLATDGASDRTLDFGFTTPPPVISGMVWRDEDGDASIDGSERGIVGLTVELYDAGGSLVATVVTDTAGRFLFTAADGLILGEEYTVVLVDGLTDHVPSTATTIIASPNDTGVVFGLQPTVSVGDLVWFDVDRDGRQDEGEPGIAGVTVRLYDADGELVATTTTDEDGRYLFVGLPYGAYTVEVVPPDGFVSTLTGVGDTEGDSSYLTSTSRLLDTPGASDLTLDFGFWRPAVSVGDLVWLDLDRDGIQDADEPGIAGVVLRLEVWDGTGWVRAVDVFGAEVADETTGEDGRYLFDRLPLGTYRVSVVEPPPGLEPTITGAGLDRGSDSSTGSAVSVPLLVDRASDMTLDFGFIVPRVSVGDLVWFDVDADGIQDEGEPGIPGVTLTLFVQDGVDGDGAPVWVAASDVFGDPVAPTVTDADGRYRFDDLPLGTYRVEVTPPAGFAPTTAGAGDDPAVDSSTGSATSVPLTTDGQHDPTLDFGFTAPFVRIGNLVWFDEDGDGLQTRDEDGVLLERGIPGVTLTITTVDGGPVFDVLGRPVTTTVTDEDGLYVFDLLPPGQYRVTVTAPPGYFPTDTGVGDDRALDSSTGSATSVVLTGAAGSTEDMSLDFGFITPIQVLAVSASLSGTIWMDLDEDGVRREDPEPIDPEELVDPDDPDAPAEPVDPGAWASRASASSRCGCSTVTGTACTTCSATSSRTR
jgi:protocatechuate 3,4-dioxygenase beta subunit